MIKYQNAIKDILKNGTITPNRTKTMTRSLFGKCYHYHMKDGFPILTTRYQDFTKIAEELLWYLQGSSDCEYLDKRNIKIWKQWTDPISNSIGPLYPVQLRKFTSFRKTPHPRYLVTEEEKVLVDGVTWYKTDIDQLKVIINQIKNDPFSRRHIVTYWNPGYLPDTQYTPIENVQKGNMALAPCPTLFQFGVRRLSYHESLEQPANHDVLDKLYEKLISDGKISKDDANKVDLVSAYVEANPDPEFFTEYPVKDTGLCMVLFQRSLDVGAAGGWNVTMYSLLLHMVAKLTNLIPIEFVHMLGDIHVYEDQIPVLSEQIAREPYPLPKLVIHGEHEDIDDFKIDDFELIDYQHHEPLKIPVST